MKEQDPGKLELYHCSEEPLILGQIDRMLHVGTKAQALMRRPKGILQRVTVFPGSLIIRMIDKGSWDKKKLDQAFRKAQIAVYLNRHEGIAFDHLEAAARYDHASDALFRKNVPSAQDSWALRHLGLMAS